MLIRRTKGEVDRRSIAATNNELADWQKDAAQSATAARAGAMKRSAQLLYNAVLADATAFDSAPAVVRSASSTSPTAWALTRP